MNSMHTSSNSPLQNELPLPVSSCISYVANIAKSSMRKIWDNIMYSCLGKGNAYVLDSD